MGVYLAGLIGCLLGFLASSILCCVKIGDYTVSCRCSDCIYKIKLATLEKTKLLEVTEKLDILKQQCPDAWNVAREMLEVRKTECAG